MSLFCRRLATRWEGKRRRRRDSNAPGVPLGPFGFFEHRRLEVMALQKLVELRTVALGEHRRLGHVPTGDLEQPYEVITLELLARFLERHERARVFLQCT